MTRLAYCTGILRRPLSRKTMAATTPSMTTARKIRSRKLSCPSLYRSKVCATALGSRATIPAKMISEIPLPIPRSVICSPSHIRNAVPAVSVMTVISRNGQPGFSTNAPWFMPSSPIAMPNPWIIAMPMVPKRVYWMIFFRPRSPSLASLARCGITTVSSCRMIDALM